MCSTPGEDSAESQFLKIRELARDGMFTSGKVQSSCGTTKCLSLDLAPSLVGLNSRHASRRVPFGKTKNLAA